MIHVLAAEEISMHTAGCVGLINIKVGSLSQLVLILCTSSRCMILTLFSFTLSTRSGL